MTRHPALEGFLSAVAGATDILRVSSAHYSGGSRPTLPPGSQGEHEFSAAAPARATGHLVWAVLTWLLDSPLAPTVLGGPRARRRLTARVAEAADSATTLWPDQSALQHLRERQPRAEQLRAHTIGLPCLAGQVNPSRFLPPHSTTVDIARWVAE